MLVGGVTLDVLHRGLPDGDVELAIHPGPSRCRKPPPARARSAKPYLGGSWNTRSTPSAVFAISIAVDRPLAVGARSVLRWRTTVSIRHFRVQILAACALVSRRALGRQPLRRVELEFSQMGRFFYWKPKNWSSFPLSPSQTISHAAQVHAIPADADIERKLRKLRPGQVVHLSGYLVDVRGPGEFTWKTSLRRDDTGDGACEIMWIAQLTVE